MRLKFRQILIHEFKSFSGKHRFRLDIPAGLHFVRGDNRAEVRLASNGSGKTTIWDAFVWCLFGRTASDLRTPDVVPWSGKKGTVVIVDVDVDGVEHRITRMVGHALRIDDEERGADAVVTLLGMSYDLVVNTIVLGQGCPLFFDMSAGEKMQLLSDVRGLERWDERSKRATERVRELETELAGYEAEVRQIVVMLKDIDASIDELKPKVTEWQEKYEERRNEVESVSKKLRPQIEALDKEVAGYNLKYDSAMTEVRGCERSLEKLAKDVTTATITLNRALDHRAHLDKEVARYTAAIENLVDVKRCPLCKQVVSRDDFSDHRADLKGKRSILEREAAMVALRPLRRSLEVAKSRQEHEGRYLESFHAKAEGALRDHDRKRAELIALQERERQVVKAFDEGEENPYASQLKKLRNRRRRYVGTMEMAEHDVKSCKRELERARVWPKGFKEVKLYILEELLQELELATLGLMEEVGLIGWDVKYVIERETKSGRTQRGITVMIASPKSKGKLVRWKSWSGGEGQRLRVIGALALSSVLLNHAGVRSNIEVLDEPTKFMSDAGVSDLCTYLAERARVQNLRIFYCDHQSLDAGSSATTSMITIRRDREGSYIKQER